MPKQILGTGNKKRVKSTPKTAYTSPAQIKIKRRHAAALDLRLQGLAFHQIGKQLGCHPSTAHDYVVKALRDIVPKETAQQVMQMELARLDALLEKYQPLALKGKGDKAAAELCLKISNQRCRLAGLYPQAGGVNVSIGGNGPSAEELGIAVKFVSPDPNDPRLRDDPPPERHWQEPRQIEARALPAPSYEPPAGAAPQDKVVPLRPTTQPFVHEGPAPNPFFQSAFTKPPGPRGWMK